MSTFADKNEDASAKSPSRARGAGSRGSSVAQESTSMRGQSDAPIYGGGDVDDQLATSPRRPWKDIALYGLARLALFVVLTAVIQGVAFLIGAPIPLIISSLLALIVALPLSMFVFKGLRLRVTRELAAWDAQRKAHKAYMEEQLDQR